MHTVYFLLTCIYPTSHEAVIQVALTVRPRCHCDPRCSSRLKASVSLPAGSVHSDSRCSSAHAQGLRHASRWSCQRFAGGSSPCASQRGYHRWLAWHHCATSCCHDDCLPVGLPLPLCAPAILNFRQYTHHPSRPGHDINRCFLRLIRQLS